MGGSAEPGRIRQTSVVRSQVRSLGIRKPITSAPGVALASWMAALNVQVSSTVTVTSQTPSATVVSAWSPMELTVKVVEALAEGATRPAASGGATNPTATRAVARATLAVRAADPRSPSVFFVAVSYMSCLLLLGAALWG